MAFHRLMLTTAGKTLYAKAQQGKTLEFTRVGIGDGNIGNGSLVNRTDLINQKLSLLIDTVQVVNENQAAIITVLKNDDLTEGFYFREIGIFAKDPDTQQEVLYLYDNAGDDGEYIPDNQSGVIINERLKFLLVLENVTSVSFVQSGNPLYLTHEDIDDTTFGETIIWSSAKTKEEINTIAQEKAIAAAGTALTAANDYTDQKAGAAKMYTDQQTAAAKTNAKDHANGLVGTLANLATTIKDNLVAAINELFAKIEDVEDDLAAHSADKANPHGVTKAQIGLANVDNIKQATKTEFDTHANNKSNPHAVTAAQVGAAPSSHVGSGGTAHAVATTSAAGFMSAADKQKLNGLDGTGGVAGTYTGDGAATRDIILGFRPSAVLLLRNGMDMYVRLYEGWAVYGGLAIDGIPVQAEEGLNAVSIISNGFRVGRQYGSKGDAWTNAADEIYHYYAFR